MMSAGRPRNPVARFAQTSGAGSHRKSEKSVRRKANIATEKDLDTSDTTLPATVIRPDGSTETILLEPKDRMQALQQIVGGYIEVVPLPNRRYLVINEDAKLVHHEVNQLATDTAQAAQSIRKDDYIAGTAVIVPAEVLQ